MQLNVQMMSILDRFSGRPALADRRPIPKSNSDRERMGVELLSRYNVLTYGELRRRVEAVSVQLCKQAGRGSLRSGDRAALLGYPGIDFTTVDFACNLIGITTVPLQTSGSMTQHLAILEETSPRLLVVSVDLLDRVDDIISHISTIERILILDYRGGESGHREALQKSIHSARITPEPLNLDSILEWEPNRVDDDHLAMLLYTSGSTGEPKGAMYSARLVGEMWLVGVLCREGPCRKLPLHAYEPRGWPLVGSQYPFTRWYHVLRLHDEPVELLRGSRFSSPDGTFPRASGMRASSSGIPASSRLP